VDEAVLKIQEKEDQQTKKHRAMTWYLYVDIYCLDYDGNVFDACLIALLAALADGLFFFLLYNSLLSLLLTIIIFSIQ